MKYLKGFFLITSFFLILVFFIEKQKYRSYVNALCSFEDTAKIIDKKEFYNNRIVSIEKINNIKNRRRILSDIFYCVTKKEKNDLAKIKKWVVFLQYKIVHPEKPPLLENGQMVYDPIWMLENKVAHCGQTNRLILDGLETIGIKGRVVQLSNHVIAEAYLDGKPLALDADLLDKGNFFYDSNNNILSAYKIHKDLSLLNNLRGKVHLEKNDFMSMMGEKDPWKYLRDGFVEEPFYYVKTSSKKELNNEYYGWNYYYTIKNHCSAGFCF